MSFFKKLLYKTILTVFRVELINPEKQPEGAILVCSNHLSNLDPVIMCASFRHPVHFMAKKELFKIPLVGSVIKAFGAFPVERGAVDLNAMKTAINYLSDNRAIGIFPQGTRYVGVDPRDTKVKSGVGMIISRAQCDILPVAVIMKKNRFCFGRKIFVVIGDIIKFEEFDYAEKSREEFDRMSKITFERICDLCDEYSYLAYGKKSK